MNPIRKVNLDFLFERGFRVSFGLPFTELERPDTWRVRSQSGIAARLMALHALFTWVAMSSEDAPTDDVLDYIERNALREFMPPDERAIVDLRRSDAHDQNIETSGWKLENIWALAWVLGFEPAPSLAGVITREMAKAIVFKFLPGYGGTINSVLTRCSPRPVRDVVIMEDLFFCAHNAVRNAQEGGQTVPVGFDPVIDGGAVYERRHALTWCISPGTPWEETDLSA